MALQEEFETQGKWLFRYRGNLPLIILVIGIAIYLWTKYAENDFYIWDTPYEFYYEILCVLIGLIGLYIRILTVGYTPKNTSGRRVKTLNADVLNTSGAYSIARHPLYLGNFLMWLGPTLLTANFWFIISFCAFYWIYYERIMYAEEQFLRTKFGDAYTEWSKNVPAFIPTFKNYKKPSIPFNWKRVLQKERNGLAALLIIFTVFNVLGERVQGENNYNYYILGFCVVSIVAFIVLKFLEKSTKILHEDWQK